MLLKLYDKNNNPQDLQRIIDILNDGGLIIYPTDTMYAIGCHGLKERAIERICRIKEIDPRKNNLSIICYDLSSISEYAKVDNNVFKLMKHNLPGPFTFILNGTNRLPKIFRNRKEVGIRMPNNNIIREIARLLDAPIMTTTLPYDEDEDLGKVPERRQKREEADWEEAESETKRRGKKERDDKKNPSREQYRKCPEEYEEDLDDDLSDADDKEIDEILDEYGVDEEDVIEEYLEDYYGENKRTPQKRRKNKNKRKNSASPYQKNR